jgi:tetratricopeptide (TPR) repeat protein
MSKALLCFGLLLMLGAPDLAAARQQQSVTIGGSANLSPQEATDSTIVEAAQRAANQRGPHALQSYVGKLKDVVSHTPAAFPLVERRGGVLIIRDETQNPMLLMLAAAQAQPGGSLSVQAAPNTYGKARLLLASWYNETRRPKEALEQTGAGLALQPDNGFLLIEHGAALGALHRNAEALASLEPWVETHPMAPSILRAATWRAIGFNLTEMGRLDDAQRAFETSLKLQPNHPGAQRELQYIAGLRAGGPKQATALQTGADALAGKPPVAKPD